MELFLGLGIVGLLYIFRHPIRFYLTDFDEAEERDNWFRRN